MQIGETDSWCSPFEDVHEWAVVRAKPNFQSSTVKHGFPILLDLKTRRICEPVLLFVHQVYVEEKSRAQVLNTCLAYTRDGKDWMQYLEEFGLNWLDAKLDDLINYVRIMDSTCSPFTGQRYATKTINRRSMFVLLFYFWASKYFKSTVDDESNLIQTDKSLRRTQMIAAKVKLPKREEEDIAVEVMARNEARLIMRELGPTPSTWRDWLTVAKHEDLKIPRGFSSRDRMACETALKTGLRVSGIVGLKCRMFERFRNDEINPKKNKSISVREKGKTRLVKFSGELIIEILVYIDNERFEITKKFPAAKKTDALFLNPASAGKHAGRGVTVRTLERAMEGVCIKCHFTRDVLRRNYEYGPRGEILEVETLSTVTRFVFHQLRHTFAVWLYYSLVRTGKQEPWLIVQARLGHSSDTVTRDIYLRATADFEAEVSDRYMDYINEE